MGFKIQGFDKLQKQFYKMEKGAKELEQNNQIPFEDLFTTSFMTEYTSYSSFDDFLEAGNFIVNSQEDFEAIPDDDFDKHVAATTQFDDWEAMLGEATEIYVMDKLGF